MRAYVAVTNVKSVAALTEYLVLGRGRMYYEHRQAGTNRMAAMICDAPSPSAFVSRAQQIARAHSRTNEGLSLIVSPPDGSYDPASIVDMRRMVADVVEGGRRLQPHARLLAVAHNDAKGGEGCSGKPHVHLVFENHDVSTGRALRRNRTVAPCRAEFNRLGAELGWAETAVTYSKNNARVREVMKLEAVVAEDRRGVEEAKASLAALNVAGGSFEDQLRESVSVARDEATGDSFEAWMSDFTGRCSKRGVTVKITDKGKTIPHVKGRSKTQGITFAARNPATKRMRHVKASAMAREFTVAGLRQAFEDRHAVREVAPQVAHDPFTEALRQHQANVAVELDMRRRGVAPVAPEPVEVAPEVEAADDPFEALMTQHVAAVAAELGQQERALGIVVDEDESAAPVEAVEAAPNVVLVVSDEEIEHNYAQQRRVAAEDEAARGKKVRRARSAAAASPTMDTVRREAERIKRNAAAKRRAAEDEKKR